MKTKTDLAVIHQNKTPLPSGIEIRPFFELRSAPFFKFLLYYDQIDRLPCFSSQNYKVTGLAKVT